MVFFAQQHGFDIAFQIEIISFSFVWHLRLWLCRLHRIRNTAFSDALAPIDTHSSALNQGVVFFYRGSSYYFKRDYLEAIAHFTQAVKLDPAHSWAYGNRGNAYLKPGGYTQAIAPLFRQRM